MSKMCPENIKILAHWMFNVQRLNPQKSAENFSGALIDEPIGGPSSRRRTVGNVHRSQVCLFNFSKLGHIRRSSR